MNGLFGSIVPGAVAGGVDCGGVTGFTVVSPGIGGAAPKGSLIAGAVLVGAVAGADGLVGKPPNGSSSGPPGGGGIRFCGGVAGCGAAAELPPIRLPKKFVTAGGGGVAGLSPGGV